MIKIKTAIDIKSQKQLTQKRTILLIITMCIGAVGLFSFVLLEELLNRSFELIYYPFAFIFVISLCTLLALRSTIKKNSAKKFINEFNFTEESINISTYQNGEVIGSHYLKYSQIKKVKETNDYFFVYINIFSAYIIGKTGVCESDILTIRKLLKLN